jgi:hypothetical protein
MTNPYYYEDIRRMDKEASRGMVLPAPLPVLPVFEPQDTATLRVRRVVNGFVITPLTKKGAGAYSTPADEMIAHDLNDLAWKLRNVVDAQCKAIIAHLQSDTAEGSKK